MTTATEGSRLIPQSGLKPELGQVFTPLPIAAMMAAMLHCRQPIVRLLDAGAGIGNLTQAVVECLCQRAVGDRPTHLSVTAYEMDSDLLTRLQETLERCRVRCAEAQIEFVSEIIARDFLECASEQLAAGLFAESDAPKFNSAILNPPYRKIHTASRQRQWLRRIGVETSNLYTGFLAAAIHLLEPGGEIVAITPRSFCSGSYFQSFRREFLQTVALDRLHLFDSRMETFREANVLQETIIFHAVKHMPHPATVSVSESAASENAVVSGRDVPYREVVQPNDPHSFIHITPQIEEICAASRIADLPCTLADLGLSISTGRVVDFRARAFLRPQPETETVPLIYPAHLKNGQITWPAARGKKLNSILAVKETEALLVPNAHYVLVRRFSTKEEKKRLVATVFQAGSVPGDWVGFENHLNYFHCRGAGLTLEMAQGLAAFLNSTVADNYFRQFNGHTQVNATDLRSFRYPSSRQLLAIGKRIGNTLLDQPVLDALIDRELDADTN